MKKKDMKKMIDSLAGRCESIEGKSRDLESEIAVLNLQSAAIKVSTEKSMALGEEREEWLRKEVEAFNAKINGWRHEFAARQTAMEEKIASLSRTRGLSRRDSILKEIKGVSEVVAAHGASIAESREELTAICAGIVSTSEKVDDELARMNNCLAQNIQNFRVSHESLNRRMVAIEIHSKMATPLELALRETKYNPDGVPLRAPGPDTPIGPDHRPDYEAEAKASLRKKPVAGSKKAGPKKGE